MLDVTDLDMGYVDLLDNYKSKDRYEEAILLDMTSKRVACYIVTKDGWDPDKKYVSARGIRQTTIQGYNRPMEFYSPVYLPGQPLPGKDNRRTLYWNPQLETDENGEAVIRCYNEKNATLLTIHAEMLYNGQPVTLKTHSVGLGK